MSQQSTASKPSLQGVRIKARKGAVKAHAKHEPTSWSPVFPLHVANPPVKSSEISSTSTLKLSPKEISIRSLPN